MKLFSRPTSGPAIGLALCLALAGTLAAASPADAAPPTYDPALTTTTLPTMHPGQTAWVSTLWTAQNRSAANFRMTASSTAATVSYPTNTATYSSFYGSSTLAANATDFAALKVTISPSATTTVTLNLTATYDLHTNNGNSTTVPKTQNLQVTIPVQVVTGASITALTSSFTSVARGAEAWQQFSVRGEKPGITALRLQVTVPAGITIAYPADAANAQPNESSTLDVDETDYFGFKTIVGSGVAPGSYNLTLSMTFGSGQQQSAIVPMTVT